MTRLMDILAGIASKEFQRRAWIEGLPLGVGDFDETCIIFNNDCNFVIKNEKEFGINNTQYLLLVKFGDVFEHFSDDNDWPPFFIDTPEWTRITNMAEEILLAFNYQGRRK